MRVALILILGGDNADGALVGEITVESEPGRGSCFRVCFPEPPAAL